MGNCIRLLADVRLNLAACKQLFLLKCPRRISNILSTICWIFWYFEPFLKIQPYTYGSNVTFPEPFYLSLAYTSRRNQSAGGEVKHPFAQCFVGKNIVKDAVIIHILLFLFVQICRANPSVIECLLLCFFAMQIQCLQFGHLLDISCDTYWQKYCTIYKGCFEWYEIWASTYTVWNTFSHLNSYSGATKSKLTNVILDAVKDLLWLACKIALFVYWQTPSHWSQKQFCISFYILHTTFFEDLLPQKPNVTKHRL